MNVTPNNCQASFKYSTVGLFTVATSLLSPVQCSTASLPSAFSSPSSSLGAVAVLDPLPRESLYLSCPVLHGLPLTTLCGESLAVYDDD